MEIRQIQYFLSVVETGSFSAAADEHYISQSSLSKIIIALEKELGVPIFDRSKRKVFLTKAGEAFLEHARKLNADYMTALSGSVRRWAVAMALSASDDNKPDFVQLNFGYRITPKDVVSVELNTRKYAWPLGIPYGDSFEAPEEKYPGHVRDVGIAVAYQRFLWKGAYAAVHAMQARQAYADEAGDRIQTGYQLFMTYRLGYHLPVFRGALFIEPSVAATHWPIRTNVPESFARKDREWPNYFLLAAGAAVGTDITAGDPPGRRRRAHGSRRAARQVMSYRGEWTARRPY